MWKRGRKRSDDERSGGDAGGGRPSKRAVPSKGCEDDGIVVCEISKNRRVSVRSWQGKIVVDIREFYVKEGQQLPGKKAEWWSSFGASTPNLQKFAIKVLSLTCSASGCERNWSVFEHVFHFPWISGKYCLATLMTSTRR